MERIIDGKYKIVCRGCARNPELHGEQKISIVNVYNGKEIPEDEPLFIFRARDISSSRTFRRLLFRL